MDTSLLALMGNLTPQPRPACIVRETVERALRDVSAFRWVKMPHITVDGQKYLSDRRGTAWPAENRIIIRFGPQTPEHRIVGVVLHELAHLACYQEGLDDHDASYDFGMKCQQAFAEWNALDGTIRADEVTEGAYMGWHGRRNKVAMAARTRINRVTKEG